MKNEKLKCVVKRAGFYVWVVVSAFLIVLLTVVTILENTVYESILQTVLGDKMPIRAESDTDFYTSDFKSKKEATAAGRDLNVEICEEGFVLLLNEKDKNGKDALPIGTPKSDSSVKANPKVSVFGHNSVDLVLGGSGSGSISGVKTTTIYDGLEAGGFDFNPTLKRFYESGKAGGKRSSNPKLSDTSSEAPTLDIGETPVANYGADVIASFGDYNDAAIVVISRLGGESFDLPRSQNVNAGGIEGNHYLQLDKNEYDMLDLATAYFGKVIVVINSLTPFQCDFIAEYNNTPKNKRIDAVMWIGGPGPNGVKAIGSLLNGSVNPSGKTTDIYPADYTKDPTWQNFGDGSQTNGGKDNSAFLQNGNAVAGYNMVSYEEGIYMGYRYYETRGFVEKETDPSSTWYDDNVVFPFGYGLSYTEFSQKITNISGDLSSDKDVEITVEVQNIGEKKGKDVVELYVSKPYYEGGIEKPYVELVDFAKTKELEKNGKDTVVFKVSPYDLASYDYNDANENEFTGYELEDGDYRFIISSDSHVDENAYDEKTINLGKAVRFLKSTKDGVDVVNRFTTGDYDDIQYRMSDVTVNGKPRKGMSRTDFEGTFPTSPTESERELNAETIGEFDEIKKLKSMAHNNTDILSVTEMPVTGAQSDVELIDLADENGTVSYTNESWVKLLDSLSVDEMLELVNNGAFKTIAIEKIGKNLTNDSDGPIGFVNFMPGLASHYKNNPTFACEIVIGCTWNKDMAYRMGKSVGESGLWGDVDGNGLPYSGWYAPAVNLHRSPFSGRNFEYYSEDPILSGKMAVNVINGCATKGVYNDLKHFALNDQETNRAGISTFCTEQALRELYLKPFEIAVKGDDSPAFSKTATEVDGLKSFKGTTGIMSSFNRIGNKWTGGDYRLMTEVLRKEWGFKGVVISDYKTDNSFMNSRQMLYAGNDLILTSLPSLRWEDADSSNVQDVTILRNASKNILYAVANSNSIQIEIVGYRLEWWKTLTIVLDCVIPVALGVWGFFVIRKGLKKYKTEASANGTEAKADDTKVNADNAKANADDTKSNSDGA